MLQILLGSKAVLVQTSIGAIMKMLVFTSVLLSACVSLGLRQAQADPGAAFFFGMAAYFFPFAIASAIQHAAKD